MSTPGRLDETPAHLDHASPEGSAGLDGGAPEDRAHSRVQPIARPVAQAAVEPWLLPALLLLVVVVVRPWLNQPLNDDWQYARAAKLLSETGKLTIDTPIAPSIVLQSYVGAGVIRLFGFSHLALRALTILLACIGLVCVERTLKLARVARGPRLLAGTLLVLHPVTLHVSITYLTEWYGYVFGLLSVWLWFGVRARRGDHASLPAWLFIASAVLAVAAYWSRQFAVLVFPALAASRIPHWIRTRHSRETWVELGSALAGAAVVAAGVGAYFAWARATGNYKPEFAKPLSALSKFSPQLWLAQCGACFAYLTAAAAPMLVLARFRPHAERKLSMGLVCLGFMTAGLLMLQVKGGQNFAPDRPLNARFPYVNNIIYATGTGPITLTDVYNKHGAHPHWSRETWWLIELAIVWSTALWGALVPARFPRLNAPTTLRMELAGFAGLWLFGSLAVTIQAYQGDVFDRYYFPCLLALSVLAPLLFESSQRALPSPSRARVVAVGIAWLSLAWFGIAGAHDYLRWNEARSELYEQALASGVSPGSIDAGFELNGWNNIRAEKQPTCIGRCRCPSSTWYCFDDSHRIVMGDVPKGYELVRQRAPSYWLSPGPPLKWVRRKQ